MGKKQPPLLISDVPSECPALIGPSQLQAWKIIWMFEHDAILDADGWLNVVYTPMVHPLIDLLCTQPSNTLQRMHMRIQAKPSTVMATPEPREGNATPQPSTGKATPDQPRETDQNTFSANNSSGGEMEPTGLTQDNPLRIECTTQTTQSESDITAKQSFMAAPQTNVPIVEIDSETNSDPTEDYVESASDEYFRTDESNDDAMCFAHMRIMFLNQTQTRRTLPAIMQHLRNLLQVPKSQVVKEKLRQFSQQP